jgi:hypothetical protein
MLRTATGVVPLVTSSLPLVSTSPLQVALASTVLLQPTSSDALPPPVSSSYQIPTLAIIISPLQPFAFLPSQPTHLPSEQRSQLYSLLLIYFAITPLLLSPCALGKDG